MKFIGLLVCLLAMSATSMDKSELINEIAEEAHLTRNIAAAALTALLEGIKYAMKYVQVPLIGFGTFKVDHRAARTGIPAVNVPRFVASTYLKEAVGRRELSVVGRLIALLMEESLEEEDEEKVGVMWTKSELVEHMATNALISQSDALAALNAFVEVVTHSLQEGEFVQLIGFGTFKVNERAERTIRSRQTGKEIKIPAVRVPAFTPSKELTEAVN